MRVAKEDVGNDITLNATGLQTTAWYMFISLMALILVQSFQEMVSTVYYHSLTDMGLSSWTLVLISFAAPLLIVPLSRKLGWRGALTIPAYIALASRLPMSMGLVDPYHLIASAVAFSSSSLVITAVFSIHRKERRIDPDGFSSQGLVGSFALGLLLRTTLNALGYGLDASIVPKAAGYLLSPMLGAALVGAAGIALYMIKNSPHLEWKRAEGVGERVTGGAADSFAPALGLGGFLFLSLVILPHPHVSAAWSDNSYQWTMAMTVASISLFVMSLFSGSGLLMSLRRILSTPKGSMIGNGLMVAGVFNVLYIHIPLHSFPFGFTWIALIDLWLVLDAFTDHRPFAGEPIVLDRSGNRKVLGFPGKGRRSRTPDLFGTSMTVSNFSAVLVTVSLVFSLTWAHAPLGGLFKGKLALMMFIGVVLLGLGGFACSREKVDEPSERSERPIRVMGGSPATAAVKPGGGHMRGGPHISRRLKLQWIVMGALTIVLILVSMTTSFFLYERKTYDEEPGFSIRVATYNIHQGFSNSGRVDPTRCLEELEEIEADIVFLQETEGRWPSSCCHDPVFLFAQRLNMNYHNGPFIGEGVYGVSIMSRFRIREAKYHFLSSEEDQRVMLSCKVDIFDSTVNLVSVHIGLTDEDRRAQIGEMMSIVNNMTGEVIMGGDLNTEPDDPMLGLMGPLLFGDRPAGNCSNYTEGRCLLSSWHHTEKRNGPLDTPTFPAVGLSMEKEHIDYIFHTTGYSTIEAGIEDGRGASDHRPLWADLRPVIRQQAT